MDRVVRKYLAHYAEPDARADLPAETSWDRVLVVPAFDEAPDFTERVTARAPTGLRVLKIVVVNAAPDHPPDAVARTESLLQALRDRPLADLCVIDRVTENRRIPPAQGVGLARKIGTDLALRLWADGRIRGRWLQTTDADAELPAQYFRAAEAIDPGAAALVWPFAHVPATDRAHAMYECSLRYYVTGLRWAGSPYAYHSVGSTLSVDPVAYAKVRGFPRRAAGEDFHVLNKLAKVGAVVAPDRSVDPIRLAARTSGRVPFGTGPAVARIEARDGAMELYDPRCFVALRRWLQSLEAAVRTGDWESARALAFSDPAAIADPLRHAVDALRIEPALSSLTTRHRGPQLRHQLRVHFDALATLRLVHRLRDGAWPSIPWSQALENAPFWPPDLG